jgi:hypothetical protein
MTIRVALKAPDPLPLRPPVSSFRTRSACAPPPTPHADPRLFAEVEPGRHFLNWQQDPFGNWVARLVFPEPAEALTITVDLVADMTVINPFDFFMEEYAENFPVRVPGEPEARTRCPYLEAEPAGPLAGRLARAHAQGMLAKRCAPSTCWSASTSACRAIGYIVRLEPGVQTPEETLELQRGPAATRPGCWCRSCATWASRRASPRAT